MKMIHGGDVYNNQVKIDFSVNVNPLGMPKRVKDALYEAVSSCDRYPDISAAELKKAVSGWLNVPAESLLFGNGASELFMAIVHGIKPKRVMIPVPSFYGYEYAAGAADCEIIFYETKREQDFCLDEAFLEALTEDIDLLFIANPNNPTGSLLDRAFLSRLLCACKDKSIKVVLDECFIDFCGRHYSMTDAISEFPNLIIVNAFTKIFAIPGVRLGYLACGDRQLSENIQRQLPEWNLSAFAQAAGACCALQSEYLSETVDFVRNERAFLEKSLTEKGIRVFDGKADFLLIYSECPLYEKLLEKGILIRDCENFRGLGKGYYRIAVKSREENEALLSAVGECLSSR